MGLNTATTITRVGDVECQEKVMERKTAVRKDGKKEVEDGIEPPNVGILIKRKRGDKS